MSFNFCIFKKMNLSSVNWKKKIEDDESSVCIDVRTPDEFNNGHIPNSMNVNFYDSAKFIAFLHELDKKKSYYLYCKSGKRSYAACEIMRELGFQNLNNLESGFVDWVECGYETVR